MKIETVEWMKVNAAKKLLDSGVFLRGIYLAKGWLFK